jgi:hypothetical protein
MVGTTIFREWSTLFEKITLNNLLGFVLQYLMSYSHAQICSATKFLVCEV